MLRVNVNLRPQEGFYFIDEEGMRHESDDLIGLIATVVAYRLRTGRPEGDAFNEVQNQILERNPKMRQR